MARALSFTPSALICLLWTASVTLALVTCSRVATVQIVATYESQQPFLRIVQKAVNEANLVESPRFRLSVVPATVDGFSTSAVLDLCRILDNNNVSAIVSVAEAGATMAAITVGGYAGLPVLGFVPGYAEHQYKDLNPFFQALNPTLDHMTEAVSSFLVANSWLSSTLVVDDSFTSLSFSRKLLNRTKGLHPHAMLKTVIMSQSASPSRVFSELSEVSQVRSRVLVVHCSRQLTERILAQAGRLDMLTGQWIWLLVGDSVPSSDDADYPSGVLAMRMRPTVKSKHALRMAIRLLTKALRRVRPVWQPRDDELSSAASCWFPPSPSLHKYSTLLHAELEQVTRDAVLGDKNPSVMGGLADENRPEASLRATVDLLNVVENEDGRKEWRFVGNVSGGRVQLEAVLWPGNTLMGPNPSSPGRWRITAALAPPFVMISEPLGNHSCLVGVPCLRVTTADKDELASVCADFLGGRRGEGGAYNVTCCHGYSVDLLVIVAKELRIDFVMYLVADQRFGSLKTDHRWDGIMADLISGAAHLAFAPLSVTAARSKYIDFSTPYYFSGISFVTSTKFRDVPLLAFLAPFNPSLWIAIFACLHVIAITAAAYEWLSPFGLNPWGRQRTKNFSLASALWVTWSLLFSHLVAFKAPKSWPNKVLINLWGCFSVIFLASYTANIAALFAGLFFQTTVNDFNDRTLLAQRVGTARGTAGESYLATRHSQLSDHMKRYDVDTFDDGVTRLRNGELDLLVGDTPVLDFYRGQELGCTLRAVGPIMNEDTYAIGMNKGSPLKDSISSLIAKYNENGYLDYLTARWYHGMPCMRTTTEMYRPMRLSIGAVAGVFIMLCLGGVVGLVILCLEHVVYKHALPDLRKKPKDTVWRSPNLMFFSQKLYRFINCVELVSPHHSAKELVNNLRTGQITSLFQKSIKRKEHEQRRRRRSKAQFFEMIQEIRRLRRSSKELAESGRRSRADAVSILRKEGRGGGGGLMADSRLSTVEERPLSSDDDRRVRLKNLTVRLQDDVATRRRNVPLPFYADESCVRLIEKVTSSQRSPSYSSDSSDDGQACLSPISASLTELHNIGQVTKRKRGLRFKVHSYEDLKSWTREPPSDEFPHACPRHGHHRYRHQRVYHELPQHKAPHGYPGRAYGQNNFLRDLPMTKFDFFDLPLRLNDARLNKLSKDDIVFLWQTSEKELRRRLQQALSEKSDLEKQLRNILMDRQRQPP